MNTDTVVVVSLKAGKVLSVRVFDSQIKAANYVGTCTEVLPYSPVMHDSQLGVIDKITCGNREWQFFYRNMNEV